VSWLLGTCPLLKSLGKNPLEVGTPDGFCKMIEGSHSFLISDFFYAMCVAVNIVAVELAVIAWIRHRYMDTPLLSAAFQVIVGGVLVRSTQQP
jgi:hypothetical protein